MDNEKPDTQIEESPERRRGRPPGTLRPSNLVKVTILLDADDMEWAKGYAEGVSGMVRRLMSEERGKGKQR